MIITYIANDLIFTEINQFEIFNLSFIWYWLSGVDDIDAGSSSRYV